MTGHEEIALRGWRSRLSALVSTLLLVQGLTGLWIWLAPFSLAAQHQVLLHTGLGLLVPLPYLAYQQSHLRAWLGQKLTAVMVLGFLLMALTLVCIASGLVLTWLSWAGPKRSELWSLVHLVSGGTLVALLPLHVLLAVLRRRGASGTPELARATQSFGRRVLAGGAAAAALVALAAGLWPQRPTELPLPPGYTLPAFAQAFEEYRGSPFAPTYARTASGGLIDPQLLAHSDSCGTTGCHEEILAEWLPSAHRFSAMNPPFQAVQLAFAADREPAETRYCAGCHDPISLFAGAKDIHRQDLSAPGMQEGASCVVCHSISQVDQRGNADYVLSPPRKYLWEHARGLRKRLSDFLIRAYPRQHLADYDRPVLRSAEFCGTCHKQFIPEALNRFGTSPGQNQFDEWRMSHWHSDDAAQNLSCRDCHMRLVSGSRDPARGESGDPRRAPDDGAHRHHGTIATNLLMPQVLRLPGWEQHVRLTEEWIRGETEIAEIADLWPSGPVASVHLVAPESVRSGSELELRAVVMNQKAGHNMTTGPLDFMQAWVHIVVLDAAGATLAEWGMVDPKTRWLLDSPDKVHEIGNPRDQGTLVLEGMPLDEEGRALLRHELWRKAGGQGLRSVFPGHSDTQLYRVRVPEGTRGPLTVRAELDFRRYRQQFLDLVVPEMERESGVLQPTVVQDSTTARIEVLPPPAAEAEQGAAAPRDG